MKIIISVSIIFFLTATIVFATDQGVLIHNGFGTGQDYIEMTQSQKKTYAMGVINGMLLAPLFGAPKGELQWFEAYIERMTAKQVATILTKYLGDNPGRWHDGLHILMYAAIKNAYDSSRE